MLFSPVAILNGRVLFTLIVLIAWARGWGPW